MPANTGLRVNTFTALPSQVLGVLFIGFGAINFLAAAYFWAVVLIFDLVYRGAYKIEGEYYASFYFLTTSMLAALMLVIGLIAFLDKTAVRARRWIGVLATVIAAINVGSMVYGTIFEWIRYGLHNAGNGETVSQLIFDAGRTWIIVSNVILSVGCVVSIGSLIVCGYHLYISFWGAVGKRVGNEALNLLSQ